MKTVAVIGAGISGLAAAHLLSRCHRVHLFEKESRLGGHTNTVVVEGAHGVVALDTGFLVQWVLRATEELDEPGAPLLAQRLTTRRCCLM